MLPSLVEGETPLFTLCLLRIRLLFDDRLPTCGRKAMDLKLSGHMWQTIVENRMEYCIESGHSMVYGNVEILASVSYLWDSVMKEAIYIWLATSLINRDSDFSLDKSSNPALSVFLSENFHLPALCF